MDDRLWAGIGGPLAPYAPGFGAELSRLGYTPLSAGWQRYLVRDLSAWLASEGLDAADLTAATVEAFLAARRAAGCGHHRSAKGLAPLLWYLRGLGVAPLPVTPVPATAAEALLERYRSYLLGERGVTVGTARHYVGLVRPFLAGRATASGVDLDLTAADVTEFVLAECRRRSSKGAQGLVSALRSVLGFLHVDGLLPGPLAAAVPSVATWRLAGLPRFLEPDQVDALLASCDRRTANGRRDLAILTVLVRLGLRCGEVARLRLADIGWRAGEVSIRGKGNRVERLPLPADVGEAIVGYLQHGRPATAQDRRVFVRVKAPHQGLTSSGITNVVVAAGRRSGLGWLTAHRLRHTAATGMLRAGSPLAEVGQVLRHRRPLSTAIYAKVDIEALRALARPWPIRQRGGAR
jgi:integrase/recombinase XerD